MFPGILALQYEVTSGKCNFGLAVSVIFISSMKKLNVTFYLIGILIGTLTMELGGVVTIHSEKTGYHAEIEFKLKVRGKMEPSYY